MELFSGKSNLHSISITPTGMRPAYPVSVDCFQFYDLQILISIRPKAEAAAVFIIPYLHPKVLNL